MAVMPWERESKNLPREFAVRPIGRRVRQALFMPGRYARCVRAALESGLIDRRTFCIFVERDPEVVAEMQRHVAKLKLQTRPYYHVGPLSALCLQGVLTGARLDYAFLDLCAPLTTTRADWVYRQLGPALSENSAVALTLPRTVRNCHFVEYCRRYFRATPHEYNRAMRRTMQAEVCGTTDVASKPTTTPTHLAERWNQRELVPFFHETSVLAAATLQALLPHHSGLLDTCVEYKTSPGSSGMRMGVVRLRNLKSDQLSRSRLHKKLPELLRSDRRRPAVA